MTTETTFTSPKIDSEKIVITFKYGGELPAGVTLSGSATISVEVRLGTDTNPSAMVNGSAQVDSANSQVLQSIKGGVRGNVYAITCLCGTTDAGIALARRCVLRVT